MGQGNPFRFQYNFRQLEIFISFLSSHICTDDQDNFTLLSRLMGGLTLVLVMN